MRTTRLILTVWTLALAGQVQAALIFNSDASWRYFKGRSEASTPNTAAWRNVVFDDSAWLSGTAPLYYGEPLTGTLLSDMSGGYTCVFLRRTFVLTNLAEISALTLNTVTDDGHIVWINGTEITSARFNMPAGTMAYTRDASSAIEPTPNSYTLTSLGFLVTGTNVIAIQAFNDSLSGSSDFVISASLSTTAPDPIAPTVANVTPAPSTVSALNQITVTFSEPVAGVNASDFLINGLPASSMSGGNDTYIFAFAQPAYGTVNISWVGGHGITDFGVPANPFNATGPGATWQYSLVDNIAPTVVYQLPFAGVTVRSLNQIEVLFSEDVTGVDASDLLINGVVATSVTPLAPGQFVFGFSQPSAGNVQVGFAAGHGIRDLAAVPNNFAGGSWSYVLDPNAVVTAVRLNELAAANITGLRDEDNEVQDWVELFNTSSNAVSLAGWSLTDDEDEPTKWVFPPVSIGARGYLIVYCSGKDRKPLTPGSRLHANFSLSPDGEFLGLYNAEVPRQLVSSFNPYPNQRTDYSWGFDPQDQMKYFLTQTPGTINGASTITGVVADTKFSHDRGFYTAPFSLSITCATPGVTIRYTTNGSAPTATTGLIYSSPISIAATRVVRAAAYKTGLLPSDVDAQTYLFLDDVIRQPDGVAPAPGWPPPRTSGGQVWDYGMDPQIVNHATWSPLIKNALLSIPTFSVVMDVAQFSDIYNNPGADGLPSERPASIELIYPDNTEGFQANCGLRIRGGFSRSGDNPKHAFRLFFRQEYGLSKLNYPVFGPTGAREFDKFDLRTFQNYSWSFQNDSRMICVRDVMSRDAQLTMNSFSARGDFYHLYINGVYWGLYNSEERPEAAFAASYLGGREEDYDTIKQLDGYISGPTDGNTDAWYRLWQAATNGFANDVDYCRVQGMNVDGTPNPAYENLVDVPNLIDYMLIILYGGNLDAPISNFLGNDSPNNWYGVRNRTGLFGGFRFISHDAEHTLLNVNEDRTGIINLSATTPPNTYGVINPDWTCGNPLTQSGGPAQAIIRSTPQYIWFRMHQNAEFRMLAADRIHQHCFDGGPLSVPGMLSAFLTRSNEIQLAMVAESARWGDAKTASPYTRDTWAGAMRSTVSGFINGRTTVLLNQLRADGLYPNVNAPSFSRDGGAVPAGFAVLLTNNAAGAQVFYTTDGRDPRLRGGNVSPTAINYTPGTPIPVNFPVTLRARARSGATWSALVEATFYPEQDFANLVVTEIMYNPPGVGATPGEEFEFLELKNAGTSTIDLSHASFDGINFTFTNGTRLAPGQFFVLGRNLTTLNARYPGLVVNGLYSGRLDNAGETITLLHPLGTRIISVDYKDGGKWPITADGFGFSLVPKDPNANPNPDSPTNWRASTNPGGSPGEEDPAPVVAGILVNEALTHTDLPSLDYIELHNPTAVGANVGGWFLTDDGKTPLKFRIPDNTTIPAGGYIVFTEADFNPTPGTNGSFTLSSQGEEVYLLSADANTNLTGYSHGFSFGAAANGVSFGRHVISTGDERFVAQTASTPGAANSGPLIGPMVIREIMYHPPDLANGVDNTDDEYIELRNITGSVVNLFDPLRTTNTWRIRGGVDFNFPHNTSLGAAQSILLVSFDPTNAATLAAFRSRHGLFAGVPIFGPYGGKLDNSSDTVSLRKPDAPDTNGVPYIVVDEVDYKDSAPWPPSTDGAGAALQRVDLAAYADDPANWIGAAPLTITGLTPSLIAVRAGTNAATATNVTFTVSAYGTGTLTYQWSKNGSDIPGATNTSLVITNVQSSDEATYTVLIADVAGSVESAPAYLFVYSVASLSVIQWPATHSVVSGGPVSFSATLAATPPPFTFEWRRTQPSPQFTNTQILNERTAFYSFTAPVLTNSVAVTQQWRLVVKNLVNPTTGISPGVFSLIILPDTDGDGIPDQWETANGFSPTTAGDGLLDADGDGLNNRDEYIAGTNPLDAASCLKVSQVSVSSPAQITFEAVSNKTYTVLYSDVLNGTPWRNLTNIVARTNTRPETVFDPSRSTNRFYRIATPQVP
jgi:hypothetical protein